ncbi:MAG: DUF2029 domain-containing protein [Candidatus Obscuribacterales bacterium]|nr:DUF2029 domain-containing protein [Candidatus Obscuribacterales bacterium]
MASSANENRKQKFRLITAIFALVFSLAVPVIVLPLAVLTFAAVNDLPEYYAGASLISKGQGASVYLLERLGTEEQIIFPDMSGRIVGLFIPPFSVPLLMPVLLMPVAAAPVLWTAFLSACALGACLVLRKTFVLSNVSTLWLLAIMCLSGPLYESLRIGQLAPVLLLAFSLSILKMKQGRDISAGLWLSILLLKPQELLPIMLYLFGASKWKVIGATVVVGAVLALISTTLVGVDGWRHYFQLVGDVNLNTRYMQPELSATVRGQLLRLLGVDATGANLVSLIVLTLTSGFIVFCGKKLKGDLNGLLFIAVPLGLVTALHCHDYDLLLLAPSIVSLVRFEPAAKIPAPVTLLAVGAGGVFMVPIYVMIHYQYLLKGGAVNPGFIVLLIGSIALATFAWKQLKKTA